MFPAFPQNYVVTRSWGRGYVFACLEVLQIKAGIRKENPVDRGRWNCQIMAASNAAPALRNEYGANNQPGPQTGR
jgi:hypothetical protein